MLHAICSQFKLFGASPDFCTRKAALLAQGTRDPWGFGIVFALISVSVTRRYCMPFSANGGKVRILGCHFDRRDFDQQKTVPDLVVFVLD